MNPIELKKKNEELTEKGKMCFYEGVTDDQIAKFEKDYTCVLPLEFREWLQNSDGGDLFLPAGIQLYGIEHKPIIDIQDSRRPDDNYIVIGALSNGDPILCENNGNRIAIYNMEAGRIEDDEIYDDFYAFLEDLPDILGIEG